MGLVLLCAVDLLVERQGLTVEGLGLAGFAQVVQCVGEIEQAGGLVLLGAVDRLEQCQGPAVQGFGLARPAQLAEDGGEV